MYQFTNQSVYLSLSVYVSVCQSIHLGFFCPVLCLWVYVYVCLQVSLHIYIIISVMFSLLVHLSVCLLVSLHASWLSVSRTASLSAFFLSYYLYLYLYLVEKDPPSSPLLMEFFNPSLRLGSSYTTQDYITYRFLCFFPSAFFRLLRNRDS